MALSRTKKVGYGVLAVIVVLTAVLAIKNQDTVKTWFAKVPFLNDFINK